MRKGGNLAVRYRGTYTRLNLVCTDKKGGLSGTLLKFLNVPSTPSILKIAARTAFERGMALRLLTISLMLTE